ncbi:MAG: hotdog fold thioesterase [Gammaproteobacteria bacterium]|nr:MAG: hotdog fold thioesterase [Gammaproteobacteria bacterium]
MEKILDFFNEKDQFAKHCGIKVTEAAAGYAKGEMEIKPHHLNGAGTVHGGALFTLADFIFAVASNSHGQLSLAINANISFFKGQSEGVLTATAKELSINPKLGTYNIEIVNEAGSRIADFTGTVYRKSQAVLCSL